MHSEWFFTHQPQLGWPRSHFTCGDVSIAQGGHDAKARWSSAATYFALLANLTANRKGSLALCRAVGLGGFISTGPVAAPAVVVLDRRTMRQLGVALGVALWTGVGDVAVR